MVSTPAKFILTRLLLSSDLENNADIGGRKLNQVGSEMKEQKLNQVGSEMPFPAIFSYVPWKHHVLIVQKSKTIEEALFYIKRTIEEGSSLYSQHSPHSHPTIDTEIAVAKITAIALYHNFRLPHYLSQIRLHPASSALPP